LLIPFAPLFSVNYQTDPIKYKSQIDSISKKEFYVLVDSMPEYPGGQSEMLEFFVTNFKYPAKIDACCKVIVEFIVDTTGQITDLKVIRNLQEDIDNEMLRVMKLMPKWKAGKLNGKPVNVKIIIPWNISLQ
jgi:protein TonB